MPGFAKAPPAVQQERQAALDALEQRAAELDEELHFIERCLVSIALRDRNEGLSSDPAPPEAAGGS